MITTELKKPLLLTRSDSSPNGIFFDKELGSIYVTEVAMLQNWQYSEDDINKSGKIEILNEDTTKIVTFEYVGKDELGWIYNAPSQNLNLFVVEKKVTDTIDKYVDELRQKNNK